MEIKDGDADQGKIRIDVIKEADSDQQLSEIALSHRFHDNGNAVILVLNVVSVRILVVKKIHFNVHQHPT